MPEPAYHPHATDKPGCHLCDLRAGRKTRGGLVANKAVNPGGLVAPLGGGPRAWEGTADVKPWTYPVTVVIPHLAPDNDLAPLRAVLELLDAQTWRPYVLVIDTGSPWGVVEQLERLRSESVETHFIRAHGWRDSSEPVVAAMDLAFALAKTPLLVSTHADCFPKRRDLLEWLCGLCGPATPAVGYEISPRDAASLRADARAAGIDLSGTSLARQPESTAGILGHTLAAYHLPTLLAAGVSWSMQRQHWQTGAPWGKALGWPDTETAFDLRLREAGIKPLCVGTERNFRDHSDGNIHHVRSYTGSMLYGPGYHAAAKGRMAAAVAAALVRAAKWREKGKARPLCAKLGKRLAHSSCRRNDPHQCDHPARGGTATPATDCQTCPLHESD